MQNFYQLLECIPVWTASLHLSLLHSVLSPMLTLICQPDFLYQELYIWIERLSKINSDLNWTVQEFPLKDSLDYCFYFFVSAEILWLQIDGLIANLWSVSSEALPLHDSTSTTSFSYVCSRFRFLGERKAGLICIIFTPLWWSKILWWGSPIRPVCSREKGYFPT